MKHNLLAQLAFDCIKDAARWNYVREVLAQLRSPKMDGQHSWWIRAPRTCGTTIDEALDRLMQEEPLPVRPEE
jgi:hypothetical protein